MKLYSYTCNQQQWNKSNGNNETYVLSQQGN